MKTDSIAFRLVAGAALWVGLALAFAGFVLAALFADHVERGFERRMTVLLESLVAVAEIGPDGSLTLDGAPAEPRFAQPLSGWYWRIEGAGGEVLRSRSLWDQDLVREAGSEAGGRYQAVGPRGRALRVIERPITLPGARAPWRFAVAAEEAELEAELRPFNVTLAWSLGVLWLGLLAAVMVQIRFGLRPLARIRAALADVRTGRADRLEGDFASEVVPLVDELNAHLGHVAEVVERARTHVGNLAHALKTPLSVLATEAARSDTALAETVAKQAEIMRRRVDHHLVRARTAATAGVLGARIEVGPVIDGLRRTLERIHAARRVRIVVYGATGAMFRGDRQDFEEMVGNVVDNACKWARSEVRIGVVQDDEGLHLTVDDDGEGLPAESRQEAMTRGNRLDESVPGSGLGLAIVNEIAGLYGGRVGLEESPFGGLRVKLVLPAAETADRS